MIRTRARPAVMAPARRTAQAGNVLLCTLCIILVVSLIGGSVLLNCTTRFNVSSTQVRALLKSGGDAAHLVPRAVLKGIRDAGTYR